MSTWPVYDDEQIADVVAVLKSGKVNAWTGTAVRDFEQAYEAYLGRRHAIALANGSLALDLALHAIDLQAGDEVIVTPRSFMASAACVPLARGVPVFADVDLESQNMTAETIARVITPKTKAIILVHLAGWPCDMNAIMELAEKHNIWVIEDCAQAHGAKHDGRPVGTRGHLAAFSFCQDKIITTGGEGGLLAMDDPAIWQRAWSFKDHGKSYDTVFNAQHPPGFRWLHESFGTNFRLTAMQAVLGSRQLSQLSETQARRAANAEILLSRLLDCTALRTPVPSADLEHAWYRLYTFVRPDRLKDDWSRDRILAAMEERGQKCFSGSCSEIYLEKAFQESGFAPPQRLVNARELGETSLAFLVDPTIGKDEMMATANDLVEIVTAATVEDHLVA